MERIRYLMITHEDIERIKGSIGKSIKWTIKDITTLNIERFANVIGYENPMYFNKKYAQSKGFKDVIAPPNFIATSANYWTNGPREEELNKDGTHSMFQHSFNGDFRRMGGGQEIEFFKEIYPGDEIDISRKIQDVYSKQGKSGLLCFIVLLTEFHNQDNNLVMRIEETQILR
jgi:acyl dehydratase